MAITLNGTTGEVFPTWTTATRPASPSTSQMGFNTTIGAFDVYSGTAWLTLQLSGALIRAPQIYITGTSYTSPAGCNTILVELLGGGGAGGGNSGSTNNAISGGGAAGAYTYKSFTVTPSTTYATAMSIGAGGTGATTAGPAGGDTTFTIGATTVTATGGTGGATSGGGLTTGVVSTNGDINFASAYGFAPASTTAGVGFLTYGGSASPFGRGGVRIITDANTVGDAASGYGSGGSGANKSSTAGASRAGGSGTQGFIRVWEFT